MAYRDKEMQRLAQNEWYAKNKVRENMIRSQRRKHVRKWFKELRGMYCCIRCGEDHPACIDFHHKSADDKFEELSRMAQNGFSKEHILLEIQKCIPLCANCHRKEHWK